MDTLSAISRMETPTLVINHCSDVGCSHPSCWASRKLYRRNAYLLMLKGVPPKEIPKEQPSERQAATARAEIPTQKVHNIVDELFNCIDGYAADTDDWHSMAGRGISAGQLSIKHMPTPMSSLSRQHKVPKSRPQGAEEEYPEEGEDEDDDFEEEEGEVDNKNASHRGQGRWRRPVAKQQTLRVQDMSSQQQGDVGRQFAALHQPSREFVWVPNPHRKPREGPLRRSADQDPSLACVDINQELGQFLQEDNYNQRQAALQERAVERSHLSTARVQRFFKSLPQSSGAKHIDLFKLPSDLLSEVLRSVDQGEPMTNESLARMVEHAAESPVAGQQPQAQAAAQASSGSEFERHVLRQRRAQLHNSDSGRNIREPQKHTSRTPVFLMDKSSSTDTVGATAEKRRLPPIEPASSGRRGGGQRKGNGQAGTASKLVVGQFKRSVGTNCQLMLGPVTADSSLSGSAPMSPRSSSRSSTAGGSMSMAVECRSDRSTLLDEVLPIRRPGNKDSALVALLAMNRPRYELDDPWSTDAGPTEALHPTTRDGTRLTTAASTSSDGGRRTEVDSAVAGVCLSLTTPVPHEDNEHQDSEIDAAEHQEEEAQPKEEAGANSIMLTAPAAASMPGLGAPPPSPDTPYAVADSGDVRPISPPLSQHRLTKAKSAASSGQLQMPTVNEDEELAADE